MTVKEMIRVLSGLEHDSCVGLDNRDYFDQFDSIEKAYDCNPYGTFYDSDLADCEETSKEFEEIKQHCEPKLVYVMIRR